MSTKEKVDEWLAISREDLEVAAICFKNSKYLHCAFMCQQSVEKVLKALIAASDEQPFPIHDLYALAEDANIDEVLNVEQKFFLKILTTYAITARYPERKKRLLSLCTKEEAERILKSSKEMIEWLKEKINERLSPGKPSL